MPNSLGRLERGATDDEEQREGQQGEQAGHEHDIEHRKILHSRTQARGNTRPRAGTNASVARLCFRLVSD